MKLPKLSVLFRVYAKKSLPAVFGLSICGCATLYGQNNHEITVTSQPPGAELYLNGIEYGKTPTSIVLPKVGFSSPQLVLKKPGYKDTTFLVETEFQNVGWWNLIVLPVFLIDLGTGYMYKIKPGYDNFNIPMESAVPTMNKESF